MSLTKKQKNERFDEIVKVLKSQSEVIDEVIALSGQQFFDDNKDKENFDFEVIVGQKECFRFLDGLDIRYDRYVFPFNYSLWYLPKRINILLRLIVYTILKNESKEIVIIDLGAGTSATQISIALVCFAMKELGYEIPKVTIHNIDLSPFMLDYGKDYVWKYFIQKYPDFENSSNIITEYHNDSWENVKIENQDNLETWLVASYLFDNSTTKENIEENFKKLILKYKPQTIISSTSGKKEDKIQALSSFLKEYFDEPNKDKSLWFTISGEELQKTSTLRKNMHDEIDKKLKQGKVQIESDYKNSFVCLANKAKWIDTENFICKIFFQKEEWKESINDIPQDFCLIDVRPIFVFYETEEELTNKLKLIFNIYLKAYRLDTITIIDKGDISNHLQFYQNEVDSVDSNDLQVELLGKLYLLWGSNKKIENKKINTKIEGTSGVLVFAFSKDNEDNIKKTHSCWKISNIIFWDKKSKDKFLEFKKAIEEIIWNG